MRTPALGTSCGEPCREIVGDAIMVRLAAFQPRQPSGGRNLPTRPVDDFRSDRKWRQCAASGPHGLGPGQAAEPVEITRIGEMETYADNDEQRAPERIAPRDEQKHLARHGKDRAENEDR